MEAPSLVFVLLRRMRTPLIVLIVAYAISVLGFVLIPGVDDKGQPWAMSFLHAFYVVTYTATTIGFGELPYLFTDAQRLWMTGIVYLTVIAWLYSIGALFSIFQEPSVRLLLNESRFRRMVGRMREPFFLVCGYGDTGSILVRALDGAGFRAVVVDIDGERISALEIEDLHAIVPGLRADAGRPQTLLAAGLRSPFCAAVVALTNNEQANLQVSLASQLLQAELPTVARADSRDAAERLLSFGTRAVVNPFDTFAKVLQHALHAPAMYSLYERLTGDMEDALPPTIAPPRGRWILVGFGRFGKAIHEAFSGEGMVVQIVELDPALIQGEDSAIVGMGAEPAVLQRAGVRDAVGLIAATNNDAHNLATVLSARTLNPDLFLIARQNQRDNDPVFAAAQLDMVMKHGELVAHEIYMHLITPLVTEVLRRAMEQSEEWVAQLVARLDQLTPGVSPVRWTLDVRSKEAPALSRAISAGVRVTVGDLQRDPHDRNAKTRCLAMLLKRGDVQILLPDVNEVVRKGDSLLFYGDRHAERNMLWLSRNTKVLGYVLSGVDQRGDWIREHRAMRRETLRQP